MPTAIWATVNIMNVRVILGVNMAFYMGIVFRPLLKSLWDLRPLGLPIMMLTV